MDPTDEQRVKFNLYTLACHELLERSPQINSTLKSNDSRGGYLSLFNKMLTSFFDEVRYITCGQVTERFIRRLKGQADDIRDNNEEAALIFDKVIEAISDKVSSWDYTHDIDCLHEKGYNVARAYFANSPYSRTHQLLEQKKYPLVVETSDGKSALKRNRHLGYSSCQPFGYISPLMTTSRRGRQIKLYFDYLHNFDSYLAYPFLFVHEYTAHIFSTDYENEHFNDGWMLHSAHLFVKHQRAEKGNQFELDDYQARALTDHLLFALDRDGIWYDGMKCAERFEAILWPDLISRFTDYTYDLAAFQPSSGTDDTWPTAFIRAIQRALDKDDPLMLREKVASAATPQELMALLDPPLKGE